MASMAIEDGIRILDRNVETLNINYFKYTNPMLSSVIMNTYHSMLKRKPEVWDYLYDNDNVKAKTLKFRKILHKLNSSKLKKLIGWYKPDIIVCTQAFPCAAMAEYKRNSGENIPIIGVVTDYGVHSYWVDPAVDLYIVPTQETKQRLIDLGVDREKIQILGIPVLPKFCMPLDNKKLRSKFGIEKDMPVALLMGGSLGMVSMDEIVMSLVKMPIDMHLIVVCGTNKKLYKKLKSIQKKHKINMHLYGYINNIEELMSVSDFIITKPGGLTVSESLAKGLPMLIVNPLPGQEAKNTDFLIRKNAAIKAEDAKDVARHVEVLVNNQEILKRLKYSVSQIARPTSALEIAERIIHWGS
jgi:processive 1,2-diacylglycerol beta-glucosyltransferase